MRLHVFGGHWQPGSSRKLPLSLFLHPFPSLAPKGKQGVDAWYRPKQVPLAETDKSASYGTDPSCHGQVRSAAADVVACYMLRAPPNEAILSHGGAAQAGPLIVGLCMCM